MAVTVSVLGSGSSGNCTFIATGRVKLLLDAGFSRAQTARRLLAIGETLEDIDALVISHEHSDHVKGLAGLLKTCDILTFVGDATYEALSLKPVLKRRERLRAGESFQVGDLKISPFSVPHDAREPSQYIFEHAEKRFGILTDLGHITEHVVAHYKTCHALLLEANHDLGQLWNGSYPESLKQRIAGDNGHLSNCQSMELLDRLDAHSLNSVVLAHLSDENNCPDVVNEQFERFRTSFSIQLASQELGSKWVEV